jgi:DNA-binding protein HU-beta
MGGYYKMTKVEFIKLYSETTGKTKKTSAELTDDFLNTLTKAVELGKSPQFVGFGSFEIKNIAERMGRNPKTGEEIKISARKALKFKAGKIINDLLNPKDEVVELPQIVADEKPVKKTKAKL